MYKTQYENICLHFLYMKQIIFNLNYVEFYTKYVLACFEDACLKIVHIELL